MLIVRKGKGGGGGSFSPESNRLGVNRLEMYLGPDTNQIVRVSWVFESEVSALDWIGLFDREETDPFAYRDFKSNGAVGGQQGEIHWHVAGALFSSTSTSYVCFRGFLDIQILQKSRQLALEDQLFKLESNTVAKKQPPQLQIRQTGRTSIFKFLFHTPQQSPSPYLVTLTVVFNILPEKGVCKLPEPDPNEDKMSSSGGVSASVSGTSVSTDSGKSSGGPSTSTSDHSLPNLPELPPGWEARVDRVGRVFYIDHATKKTTWQRPEYAYADASEAGTPGKKYHFFRRTIGNSVPETDIPNALKFLRRADFVNILHANTEALRIYNESQVLRHLVHKLRKSEERVDKYEHNREFVLFVNTFADITQPLPTNWQESGSNPKIFINHGTRKTTLLDPRLPVPQERKRRTRSAPPQRNNIQKDSNGNLLDIVNRTEEIAAAVEKRMPQLATKVKRKLKLIERMGATALDRLANDVDLILAISMLDSEENGNVSDFDEKVAHFYNCLQRNGCARGPQKIKLRFSRTNLLQDAYDQILSTDSCLLKRARLSITFDDEDGLDYGGPSRELFYLLSRELFNPYYGLFEYSGDREYMIQINPMSTFIEQHLKWMELAGKVLGLALVHRCLVDTFFTRVFYKYLLGQKIELEDLELLDNEFYNSLIWIRENVVMDDLELTFMAMCEIGGEIIEKELLPNGKELKVNEHNKEHFIRLMVKWRAERGVEPQLKALLYGFHQIVEKEFLYVLTPDEIKMMLSGIADIDLEDWRRNTEYRGGYYEEHIVIQWFWDVVEGMSNADRLKLLQFVTGTSSIPFEGFRGLRGSNGPKKFTIERWGQEECLPRAHTCFNRLDLPSYRTRHMLTSKLHLAIKEGINYAIE
ncbi:unnamed protein product, partial [Mesorhabditis spiculigera]